MTDTTTRRDRRRRGRLEVRTTEQQEGLLREAAALEHKTVSAFVLETATERARAVIAEQRDLVLSPEAFDRFYEELDRPAEAVPELVELFSRPRRIPPA